MKDALDKSQEESHPSRGAWIEIGAGRGRPVGALPSHPSRGAWIEIDPGHGPGNVNGSVAPLAGCVD